jgi:hypothetical protein
MQHMTLVATPATDALAVAISHSSLHHQRHAAHDTLVAVAVAISHSWLEHE